LGIGNYELHITAANGDYQDAVMIPFRVAESLSSHAESAAEVLKTGMKPAGSDTYLTTLLFGDEAKSMAMSSLFRLAGEGSVRVEQRIAALYGSRLLAEKFDISWYAGNEAITKQAEQELLRYQNYEGGIAAFPYSDPDLEVSVLCAAYAKDYFCTHDLAQYFYNILNQEYITPDETALSLWGLASLGEPALNDIYAMLAAPGLSAESELYLALALYAAGDGANAKTYAAGLMDKYVEDLGSEVRAKINMGDDGANARATARLALLAAVFDLTQAEGLYLYMQNNTINSDYFLLEQLGIAVAQLERIPKNGASFSYTLAGDKHNIDLDQYFHYSLTVTPEQLKEISFSDINGQITVTSLYQQDGLPQKGNAAVGELSFIRKYNDTNTTTISLDQKDMVKVQIDYHIDAAAPNGFYSLVDFLPAGLKFNFMAEGTSTGVWLYQQDGRKLTFGIWKSDDTDSFVPWARGQKAPKSIDGTIVYYAHPVMTGTFTAEPAYFGHSRNSEILILAPAITMEIK
ncbi:MAG: hypothetical protein LBB91_01840, partial [Clostridiales bacterium]|nr:hypothetical protein [Clostridiales bacterium]